jgi:hypothetical protein
VPPVATFHATGDHVTKKSAPAAADRYPKHLKHGMSHAALVYEHAEDWHAKLADGAVEDAGPMQLIQGQAAGTGVHAVYRDPASGCMRVPSGRVMLRFSAHVKALERAADIEAAGYRITSVLAYAPQAAWLESASKSEAAALRGLPALEALPDVENVEPQWLTPRALR